MADFTWTDLENAVPGQPESGSPAVVEPLNDMGHEVERLGTAKQDTLESGTNIKTVNGNSLLGSGNIQIEGSGGTADDISYDNQYSDLEATNVQDAIDEIVFQYESTADVPNPYDGQIIQIADGSFWKYDEDGITWDKLAVQDAEDTPYDNNDSMLLASNVQSAIDEVARIAKGAQQAISFTNYQSMITAFNNEDYPGHKVGQSIYIVTLDVPDLWVSKVENTLQTYTYTTDTAFTADLKTNGYVRVGYYRLSALETGKVDLTGYYTKPEADNLLADKLTEPSSNLAVGKYFRIASIDNDGHAVLECVDLPIKSVSAVETAITPDANGNVNIPAAGGDAYGLVMAGWGSYGAGTRNGRLCTVPAVANNITGRSVAGDRVNYCPIVPATLDFAVKAAMTDGIGAAWSDSEKAAALLRMGLAVDNNGIAVKQGYTGSLISAMFYPPKNFGKKVGGVVGDNIKVYRSVDDETIVFVGSGEMYDASGYNDEYLEECVRSPQNKTVKQIYIQDGITSLGKFVLGRCYRLDSSFATDVKDSSFAGLGATMHPIIVPKSVTNLNNAFEWSKITDKIVIKCEGALTLLNDCFVGNAFETIEIPSATAIMGYGRNTFQYLARLKNFTIGNDACLLDRSIGFHHSSLLTAESLVNIANHLKAAGDLSEFDSTKTYGVGDGVIYNGSNYVCATAVTQAGEWDSTKWELGTPTLTLHSTSQALCTSTVGTVADGVFTIDNAGSVTLTDFITNTKGWTIA